MATKTFIDGTVLSASDINTYAANPASVVVASGSFSATTTFDVSGFGGTYKDYDLRIRVTSASSSTLIRLAFMSGATVYATNLNYSNALYYSYGGSTTWTAQDSSSNGTYIALGGIGIGYVSLQIRLANMGYALSSEYPTVESRHTKSGVGYIAQGHQQTSGVTYNGARISSPANMTGTWVLSGLREG